MRCKQTAASIIACMAMAVGMLVLPITAANADDAQSCSKELGITKPSTKEAEVKTPVILVHGWNSNADIWSEGTLTMRHVLTAKDTVVYPFDYEAEHYIWVTNGDAAHRLAKTIVCFSKLYNDKKVVVVAHSMGGLLTRAALTWDAYSASAKDAVGHIVTIGTPHNGTLAGTLKYMTDTTLCNLNFAWWGGDDDGSCDTVIDSTASSAMQLNSPQLKALAKFPEEVTVDAIAGNVTHHFCALWACIDITKRSDLLVGTNSATDEYTSTGVGDGKQVFRCSALIAIIGMSDGWCEHSNMLKASAVQKAVKTSIDAYLAKAKVTESWSKLPPYQEYDFFSRFSLPFLDTWGTGMSSPDSVLNVVDNTTCSGDNSECPHINIVDLTKGYGKTTYGAEPVAAVAREACSTWEQDHQTQHDGHFAKQTKLVIGGKPAAHYTQLECVDLARSYGSSLGVWYVPSRKLLVIAYDTPSDSVSYDNLLAVLNSIQWK